MEQDLILKGFRSTTRRNYLPPEWFAEGVEQFLEAVQKQAPRVSRFRRARPLVGLPLVGTGHGNAEEDGKVARSLLDKLWNACQEGIDVALVTHGSQHAAGVQAVRAADRSRDWWQGLDEGLRTAADRLAKRAIDGDLALFLGAGISSNVGLPTWDNLLEGLADKGNFTADQKSKLKSLDHLDQATALKKIFHIRMVNHRKSVGHLWKKSRCWSTHAVKPADFSRAQKRPQASESRFSRRFVSYQILAIAPTRKPRRLAVVAF
jgi:hypothetical protein